MTPLARSILAALAAAFLVVVSPVAADGPTQSQIESDLTCQCGCGLTVHSCNHLNCSSALPLRDEVREQISLGKARDNILLHFEEKYGEKVLSAPTTRGFNLAAWIVPFIVIGLGGIMIAFILLRWRRQTPELAGAPGEALGGGADDGLRSRLEDELRDFDDRS